MAENRELFDRYAADYSNTVEAATRVSGYRAEYFAEQKARLVSIAVRYCTVASVLDFGCGIGNTTRALARALAGATVTGVDVSAESVAVAEEISEREGVEATFRVGGGERLPFVDGSFDLVFASNVFHHIERGEQAHWARELRRVLRPGGRFVLFEHNPYNPLTRRAVRDCPFDTGVTLLAPGYSARLLESAGFAVEPPHYYLFFPRFLQFLNSLEPRLSWLPLGAQYFLLAHKSR